MSQYFCTNFHFYFHFENRENIVENLKSVNNVVNLTRLLESTSQINVLLYKFTVILDQKEAMIKELRELRKFK